MNARAFATWSIVLFLFLTSSASAIPPRQPVDEAPTAIVLCYHIVEAPQDARMEVSRETFRQHMRYLAATGYNVIPLKHLYEYVAGKRASIPKNAVVITVDDGWSSAYTEVFPEMQRRKFPFTLFIYPNIINKTPIALSWKQVKEMSDAGVDIQSHSFSHPFLTHGRHRSFDEKKYAAWLERELVESRKAIEKVTGRPVTFLAYPYGDFDSKVVAAAGRAGYEAALTCEFGPVRKGSDPLRMKRVVIDKRMDFAAFRRFLGAGSMKIEEMNPPPGDVFEPAQPLIVKAKIPNHKNLDPKSVGITLMGLGSSVPYSYDPRDGSISIVVRDAVNALKGKSQRALIWATELKTGKRVEASWTFKVPDPNEPRPQQQPNVVTASAPPAPPAVAPAPAAPAPATNGGASSATPAVKASLIRAPKK